MVLKKNSKNSKKEKVKKINNSEITQEINKKIKKIKSNDDLKIKKSKENKKIKNKLSKNNSIQKDINSNQSMNKNETNKKELNSKNIIIRPFNRNLFSKFKNTNSANTKEFKKEMEEYEKSFEDILEFSKKITPAKKKAINCIIFHTENSDGVMSANISLKFLLENKKTDISLIPTKPFSGYGKLDFRITQHEELIKNKNVLILDLQYNHEMLTYFKNLANNVYVIDDHSIANSNDPNYFTGKGNHAAIAYTWKFFYSKKSVPLYVQIIDNDDRKLQLPYLSQYRNMSSFFNYRIFHSPYLKIKFDSIQDFKNLDAIVNDEYKFISNLIGHYYDELANNIKEQVARNARKATFQGHPVYVLNYNDPVLYKMVARQMLSNAQKKGDNIHFAVLWGYEYTNNLYKVYLCEFHGGKPKYNLPYIAKTLGNIGKTSKGGGGDKYIGNFYWPRNKQMDIWDLFSKNYIKNKMY